MPSKTVQHILNCVEYVLENEAQSCAEFTDEPDADYTDHVYYHASQVARLHCESITVPFIYKEANGTFTHVSNSETDGLSYATGYPTFTAALEDNLP